MNLKLNVKNAIFVSLAMIIWGIYLQLIDTTVQIVIVSNLGQTEEVKGIILAIINFLPLLLFPLFAKLSDNTTTRIGRRAPFIIIGTILTVFFIVASAISAEKGSLIGYALFFTLSYIGISIYRPAATAILPDIIPKPLRSKANAIKGIINAFGGLLVLGLVAIFGDENMLITYIISAGFMIVILILYLTNINEPKLIKEAEFAMANYEAYDEKKKEDSINDDIAEINLEKKLNTDISYDEKLGGLKYVMAMPKEKRKSLFLILLTMFFLTFGYGAMISTYQNYAFAMWDMTHNQATIFIVIIGAGGLISTPFIAKLSDSIGRKQTMMIGLIIFILGLILIVILEKFAFVRYLSFFFMGSGWAFTTIISFPMILELSDAKNNGVFTAYYTIACTIPKAITAYTSGVLLTRIGYQILYPYTLIFMVIAIIIFIFVKHGNVKNISYNKQEEIK